MFIFLLYQVQAAAVYHALASARGASRISRRRRDTMVTTHWLG